jgi:SAM-dependent methyltransferase
MNGRSSEGFWGKQKARWYSEGLRHSDYADKVVEVIRPKIYGCSSLLDLGAGCGALCIPLAREFDRVLALDSSSAMIDELRREANARGANDIETKLASWDEVDEHLGIFDVVLVANVPGVLDNATQSIERLERFGRRFIFLVLGTPWKTDKFYFRELWPLIFGEAPPAKNDYFDTYSVLYEMGIYAGVEIVNYDFDQPFRDIDEAVAFWKAHMRLDGAKHDGVLREFLSERLDCSEDLLWARVPKQSAVIWWRASSRKKN